MHRPATIRGKSAIRGKEAPFYSFLRAHLVFTLLSQNCEKDNRHTVCSSVLRQFLEVRFPPPLGKGAYEKSGKGFKKEGGPLNLVWS